MFEIRDSVSDREVWSSWPCALSKASQKWVAEGEGQYYGSEIGKSKCSTRTLHTGYHREDAENNFEREESSRTGF